MLLLRRLSTKRPTCKKAKVQPFTFSQVLFLVGTLFWCTTQPSISQAGSLHVGDKAENFTLKSVAGPNIRLSEQRGKVIVLAFWASWCNSCQPYLDFINQLIKEHDDKGVELWVITSNEEPTKISKTVRHMDLNASILLDPNQNIANKYFIDELPTTVLIDRNGTIRSVYIDFNASDKKRYQHELLDVATE